MNFFFFQFDAKRIICGRAAPYTTHPVLRIEHFVLPYFLYIWMVSRISLYEFHPLVSSNAPCTWRQGLISPL